MFRRLFKSVSSFLLCLLLCVAVCAEEDLYMKSEGGYPHPETNPETPVMLRGDWFDVATSIDFFNLPTIEGMEHSVVSDVSGYTEYSSGGGLNLHGYVKYYDGKFWCMWSDGPQIEDRCGQRVAYAVSEDGVHYSEKMWITDYPDGYAPGHPLYGTITSEGTKYIARGFWELNGELLALMTYSKADQGSGYLGTDMQLIAYVWDTEAETWKYKGLVADNAINNFEPKQLPNGKWFMACRDNNFKCYFLTSKGVGDDAVYNEWERSECYDKNGNLMAMDEPDWGVLPDGNIFALFRMPRVLYRAFSTDMGKTWSTPTPTDFTDAKSKFIHLKLSNGMYVLINNARHNSNTTEDIPSRNPLCLSVSTDGLTYDKMFYLVGGRSCMYPHIIEQDGYLYIQFSGAKHSIEMIKLPISALENAVENYDEYWAGYWSEKIVENKASVEALINKTAVSPLPGDISEENFAELSKALADIDASANSAKTVEELRLAAEAYLALEQDFAKWLNPAYTAGEVFDGYFDNEDACFSTAGGTWAKNSKADNGSYGGTFVSLKGPVSGAYAKWDITVPNDGYYIVSMWWASHTNRPIDATVDVVSGESITKVSINQQKDGSQWNVIATVYFEKDAQNYVKLNVDGTREFVANPYHVADAIRVESVNYSSLPKLFEEGTDLLREAKPFSEGGAYFPEDITTFRAALIRAYAFLNGGDSSNEAEEVELLNAAIETFKNSALPAFDAYDVGSFVVDDADSAFSTTPGADGKTWKKGSQSGGWNTYYYSFNGTDTSATARWDLDINEDGKYIVYMWYRDDANSRASAAPVEIHSGGDVSHLTVNQLINGSMWFKLGEFDFKANEENYVLLIAGDRSYHMADAIRVQKVGYAELVDIYHRGVNLLCDVQSDDAPACYADIDKANLKSALLAAADILENGIADKETVKAAMTNLQAAMAGEHISGDAWYNDTDTHWHICTECGDKSDISAHIFEIKGDKLVCKCGYAEDVKITVSEADKDAAEALYFLGFVKNEDGTGNFALDKKLSREEAAALVAHFFGSGNVNLSTAYAFSADDTENEVNATEFLSLVLEAMGYSFDNPIDVANEIGLTDKTEYAVFGRCDAISILYKALFANKNDDFVVSEEMLASGRITEKSLGYAKRVASGETIIVACAGDSITEGHSASDKSKYSYPAQLQRLLGDGFEVINCGKSGAYVMNADSPYNYNENSSSWYKNAAKYKTLMASGADIVIVMLGTNDARSMTDKAAENDFVVSYKSILADIANMESNPEIYLSTPIPAVSEFILEQGTATTLPRLIRNVGAELSLPVVETGDMLGDYFRVMLLYNDSVHPTDNSYPAIALQFYNEVFGHSEKLPELPLATGNVVYVSDSGSFVNDGSSPENAVDNLATAVAMLRENGGTVVVCGALTMKETYLAECGAPVKITSLYGDEDYRKEGAKLIVHGNLMLSSDVIIENLDMYSTLNAPSIYCRYNNLTIGEGISWSASSTSIYPMAINAGMRVDSAVLKAEDVSFFGECKVVINSGSWTLVRGGNYRKNAYSTIGTIEKGAKVSVIINGADFPYVGKSATAVNGMNSCDGEVYMEINSATFAGDVVALHNIGDNTTGENATFTGELTLKITSGTFGDLKFAQSSAVPDYSGISTLILSEEMSEYGNLSGFDRVELEVVEYTLSEVLLALRDFVNDRSENVPDLNGDGKVSLIDILRMLKRLVA